MPPQEGDIGPVEEKILAEPLLHDAPRILFQGRQYPALAGIPLLRKLGQGGMATVFCGFHLRLQVEVAVKVMSLHLAAESPLMVQRFIREAQIAAQVQSPHLVHMQDVNEEAGLYYIVMEYVHGLAAQDYLEAVKNTGAVGIPEADALAIAAAACEGLRAAHSASIVHRDIKPHNIMIPFRGRRSKELDFPRTKVMDLGLARHINRGGDRQGSLTVTNETMGTAGYMAPEQILDARQADTRSDVFSMGATIYTLLAGRSPFKRKTQMQTIMATMASVHEPLNKLRPDISLYLVNVVENCLGKDPAQRYADAGELLADLKKIPRLLAEDRGTRSTLHMALPGQAKGPAQATAPPPATQVRAAPSPTQAAKAAASSARAQAASVTTQAKAVPATTQAKAVAAPAQAIAAPAPPQKSRFFQLLLELGPLKIAVVLSLFLAVAGGTGYAAYKFRTSDEKRGELAEILERVSGALARSDPLTADNEQKKAETLATQYWFLPSDPTLLKRRQQVTAALFKYYVDEFHRDLATAKIETLGEVIQHLRRLSPRDSRVQECEDKLKKEIVLRDLVSKVPALLTAASQATRAGETEEHVGESERLLADAGQNSPPDEPRLVRLRKALGKAKPEIARSLADQADKELRKRGGDLAEALAKVTLAVKLDPAYEPQKKEIAWAAGVATARACLDADDLAGARRQLDALAGQQPNDRDLAALNQEFGHVSRGETLENDANPLKDDVAKLDNYKQAEVEYEQAVELRKGGIAGQRRSKLQEKMTKLSHGLCETKLDEADRLLKNGGGLKKADQAISEAEGFEKDNPRIAPLRQQLDTSVARFDKAIAAAKRLLGLGDRENVLSNIATAAGLDRTSTELEPLRRDVKDDWLKQFDAIASSQEDDWGSALGILKALEDARLGVAGPEVAQRDTVLREKLAAGVTNRLMDGKLKDAEDLIQIGEARYRDGAEFKEARNDLAKLTQVEKAFQEARALQDAEKIGDALAKVTDALKLVPARYNDGEVGTRAKRLQTALDDTLIKGKKFRNLLDTADQTVAAATKPSDLDDAAGKCTQAKGLFPTDNGKLKEVADLEKRIGEKRKELDEPIAYNKCVARAEEECAKGNFPEAIAQIKQALAFPPKVKDKHAYDVQTKIFESLLTAADQLAGNYTELDLDKAIEHCGLAGDLFPKDEKKLAAVDVVKKSVETKTTELKGYEGWLAEANKAFGAGKPDHAMAVIKKALDSPVAKKRTDAAELGKRIEAFGADWKQIVESIRTGPGGLSATIALVEKALKEHPGMSLIADLCGALKSIREKHEQIVKAVAAADAKIAEFAKEKGLEGNSDLRSLNGARDHLAGLAAKALAKLAESDCREAGAVASQLDRDQKDASDQISMLSQKLGVYAEVRRRFEGQIAKAGAAASAADEKIAALKKAWQKLSDDPRIDGQGFRAANLADQPEYKQLMAARDLLAGLLKTGLGEPAIESKDAAAAIKGLEDQCRTAAETITGLISALHGRIKELAAQKAEEGIRLLVQRKDHDGAVAALSKAAPLLDPQMKSDLERLVQSLPSALKQLEDKKAGDARATAVASLRNGPAGLGTAIAGLQETCTAYPGRSDIVGFRDNLLALQTQNEQTQTALKEADGKTARLKDSWAKRFDGSPSVDGNPPLIANLKDQREYQDLMAARDLLAGLVSTALQQLVSTDFKDAATVVPQMAQKRQDAVKSVDDLVRALERRAKQLVESIRPAPPPATPKPKPAVASKPSAPADEYPRE
ncbi:MAG: serine/threonine-protein kinase [Planctomycetota bacterium]|nr:serine/threonine-protein kinase [Planctomycetota bacterium]